MYHKHEVFVLAKAVALLQMFHRSHFFKNGSILRAINFRNQGRKQLRIRQPEPAFNGTTAAVQPGIVFLLPLPTIPCFTMGIHTSKTATDFEEIKKWAAARGGKPSCMKGTGKGLRSMLRFMNYR